tara:strand:- start:4104 stop:4883 length:780 start_codon:yes stop_codon:yes gene_type:complete
MEEKTKDKQVSKAKENLPSLDVNMFVEDSSSGLENVSADDLAIPFLRLAQALSPQVNEREGAYIKDCKQGDIFNTVDNTFYKGDQGVQVVPVSYKRSYLEWAPDRKGLVTVHESSEILKDVSKNDRGVDYLPNGNQLQTTANHYVLILDGNGNWGQAILAFAGSQLKKSRKWNSIMSGLKMTTTDGKVFTPPTFSHKYLLKSVVEQNDQGSWFGWDISIVEQLSAEEAVIYAAAKQFSANTNSGAVVSTKEKNADDLPF